MEQVEFSPVGIAKKEHELYGLDDDALRAETQFLRSDIIGWSRIHFKLNDEQLNWMEEQDDTFRYDFANDIGNALDNRWDIDFLNEGPPPEAWKSKRISAKQNAPVKQIIIWVHKADT